MRTLYNTKTKEVVAELSEKEDFVAPDYIHVFHATIEDFLKDNLDYTFEEMDYEDFIQAKSEFENQ